jgi:RNA-directed DNA polymerase
MARSQGQKRTLLERVIWGLYRAQQVVCKNARSDSSGSDGVTASAFQREWRKEKVALIEQLRSGSYRFQPLVGLAIAKDRTKPLVDGNIRPISIPAIRDRVVQRAILDATWPFLRDKVHTPTSFGGIREYAVRGGRSKIAPSPRKSVRLAVKEIVRLQTDGFKWVFETDIRDFFPSIDRKKLLADIASTLPDTTIDGLFSNAVAMELANPHELGKFLKYWDLSRGVPQGGILSPLLANFYLHDFDALIQRAGYKLVRYVDDLVVLTRTRDEAEAAYSLVRHELSVRGLAIHELGEPSGTTGRIKTRISGPGQTFDFLGVRFSKTSIQPMPAKWDKLRDRISEVLDVHRRPLIPLAAMVPTLNLVISGWISAYGFCFLPHDRLKQMDQLVRERVSGWLAHHEIIKRRYILVDNQLKCLGIELPSMLASRNRTDAIFLPGS